MRSQLQARYRFEGIIGQSRVLRELFDVLETVATTTGIRANHYLEVEFGGEGFAAMALEPARKLMDKPRAIDEVSVIAAGGAETIAGVERRLEKRFGKGVQVETPQTKSDDIESQLQAFNAILYFFAAMALVTCLAGAAAPAEGCCSSMTNGCSGWSTSARMPRSVWLTIRCEPSGVASMPLSPNVPGADVPAGPVTAIAVAGPKLPLPYGVRSGTVARDGTGVRLAGRRPGLSSAAEGAVGGTGGRPSDVAVRRAEAAVEGKPLARALAPDRDRIPRRPRA